MNTSMQPAMMPGLDSGSVICRNAGQGGAEIGGGLQQAVVVL
jgi:hypothetical protein